jgi:dTDP-4-amino-4,6-dideoxygalactose transaminase
VAEDLCSRSVYLPMHTGLNVDDVDFVCQVTIFLVSDPLCLSSSSALHFY